MVGAAEHLNHVTTPHSDKQPAVSTQPETHVKKLKGSAVLRTLGGLFKRLIFAPPVEDRPYDDDIPPSRDGLRPNESSIANYKESRKIRLEKTKDRTL